ncbi:WD40 repeat domain-containing protein [Lignipirellula cremea]|uniref:WD domain, G-beta repeat n=1 Tax=Lignipirellula cremea TaxID=2528010 RepID=A0A518DPD0_9BACT|nr:hypothetical protein [Lignipirellula cremea]QDU93691.1 WD domain, G-beta repeat [Lignipirellula cremea]
MNTLTNRLLTLLTSLLFVGALLASLDAVRAQAPLALEGHTNAVAEAAPSPDGQRLATAGFDGELRIWSIAGGEALRTLSASPAQVLSVAVSPSGRGLVSGSRDGVVRVWDFYNPAPLVRQTWEGGPVHALAYASDGSWLVSGSADKAVRISKLEGLSPLPAEQTLLGHSAAVLRTAINADNSLLASADALGEVRLWNPADGDPLGVLGAHAGTVAGLQFHPQEPLLLTAGADGAARLWRLPILGPVDLPAGTGETTAVAISADGKLLAAGAADKSIRLFAGAPLAPTKVLAGAADAIRSLALNEDASLLAAADAAGVIRFWATVDGADNLALYGPAGPVNSIAFNTSGDRLAAAGEDGMLRVWKLPQPVVPLAGHALPVRVAVYSADGKILATAGDDKLVKLWNTADGAALRSLPAHTEAVTSVAWNAANTQLAAGDAAGEVRLSNPADAAAQGTLLAHQGAVTQMAYAPTGEQLITAGEDGLARWWKLPLVAPRAITGPTVAVSHTVLSTDGVTLFTGDGPVVRSFTAATGAAGKTYAGQVGPVAALAVDAAGAVLASGNDTGVIQLWNAADGVDRLSLHGHVGPIADLAFHPAGKQIATAGADGDLRIWNLPTAAKPLPGGAAMPVVATAFSSDGALVATAGVAAGKPAVIVRNAATGAVTGTVLGHEGAITSVAFSGNKTRLITGSADKTARVWNLSDPKFPEVSKFTHAVAVTAVALSVDGAAAFSAAADNSLIHWNPVDGVEVKALAGHTGPVQQLAVAGALLASGSTDKSVKVWTIATGALARTLAHGEAVKCIAFSADGTVLASAGDASIKTWTAATGAAIAEGTGFTGPLTSLAGGTEGRFASTAADGVRLWDAAGATLQAFPPGAAADRAVAWGTGGVLTVVDLQNGLRAETPAIVARYAAHPGGALSLVYSKDGAAILSSGVDKAVKQWTAADGKLARTFTGPTDVVRELAISPDGLLLAGASADKNAYLWPLAAGPAAVPAALAIPHPTPLLACSLSADGKRLATGSDDAELRVWDTTSGLLLQRFAAHQAAVTATAFAPDNVTLYTGSADKTLAVNTLGAIQAVAVSAMPVRDLALSTDGALLATVSDDKQVRLYNAADGAVLQELPAAATPLTRIALRGDKTQLAAAGESGVIQLWPIAADKTGAVTTLDTGGPVLDLDYAADGLRLAAAHAAGVRVYDPATSVLLEQTPTATPAVSIDWNVDGQSLAITGANTASLQPLSLESIVAAHTGAATGVAFSADGKELFSAGADKKVAAWTLADGTSARVLAGPAEALNVLRRSRDGKRLLATTADKQVYVWDLAAPAANQPAVATLDTGVEIQFADISHDGARAAVADAAGQVHVWDVATGAILERFTGHEGAVLGAAFAGDGVTLATGGVDKTARVWTVSATRVIPADAGKLGSAAFLPDGLQIVSAGDEMKVKFFDLEGKMARELAPAAAPLVHLTVRPDGAQIAACDATGKLMLWTTADGALAHTIESGAVVAGLDYSDDSQKIALAGADMHLRVYGVETGELLTETVEAAALTAVAFAPGGQDLLTGAADNGVAHWSVAAPVAVQELTGHQGAVYSVAYSPDGKFAASCGADLSVRLWDLETGAAAKQFAGHTKMPYSVQFSPDGLQLLTAGADGTVRLWDIATAKEIRQFALEAPAGEVAAEAAPAPFYTAAFSPTGAQIAAAGADHQIYLWTTATGALASTIAGHEDAVYRVQYNPAGTRLLSCGHSGDIQIWNAANGASLLKSTLPSVAYSACYTPDGKSVLAAGADSKAYLLPLPAAAQ